MSIETKFEICFSLFNIFFKTFLIGCVCHSVMNSVCLSVFRSFINKWLIGFGFYCNSLNTKDKQTWPGLCLNLNLIHEESAFEPCASWLAGSVSTIALRKISFNVKILYDAEQKKKKKKEEASKHGLLDFSKFPIVVKH